MADSPVEDQELLRQLRKGNETAFTALYERYQGVFPPFALHMSGNTATAEEVTQEVFMLLIGNPKGYQADKGPLGNYLFGVARNLTLTRGTAVAGWICQLKRNGWIAEIRGSPAIWIFFLNSATQSCWSFYVKRCWRCRSSIAKWLRCVTWKR